jgi:hypothetical protein
MRNTNNENLKNIQSKILYKEIEILRAAKARLHLTKKRKMLLLSFYNLLFSVKITTATSKKNSMFFFYSSKVIQQKHTREMKNVYLDYLNDIPVNECELREFFDPFQFIKKIYRTLIYFVLLKKYVGSLHYRIVIATALSKGRSDTKYLLKYFLKEKINIKLVTTFCDAIGAENLVAQIANKININTVTLQHGQYRFLKEENMSADVEAYENFVSSYLLSWGEATTNEFLLADIDPNRLVQVGRLVKKINYELKGSLDESQLFGVILSGENQQSYNIELLKFATELAVHLNINFNVRLHPSNSASFYKKYTTKHCLSIRMFGNQDYFTSCKFSIQGMTGLFLDCIEAHHPFVFYDNGYLADVFIRSGVAISTKEDVIAIIDKFQNVESFFTELKVKYNDNEDQSEKVNRFIKKLMGQNGI